MRFAIISDIHSNLEALTSVFLDLSNYGKNIDNILVTGDIVGYGPNPNECCAIIRFLQNGKPALKEEIEEIINKIDIDNSDKKKISGYILSMGKKALAIAGNHDKEVIGEHSFCSEMATSASKAAKWTTDILKKENFKFLKTLRFKRKLRKFGIELVHSTPVYPRGWEYPKNAGVLSYEQLYSLITFAGHTHKPAAYLYKKEKSNIAASVFIPADPYDSRLLLIENASFERQETFNIVLDKQHHYYINPGSVGQPRDGIPDASFMIYDTDTTSISLIKSKYNPEITKQKILDAKLPRELASRVVKGV